ncbi:hypothetical protein BJY04DRAFT_190328 [Aspergillus karnatakaensis]|uniref:NmrA-like family protein n=1 Tax=Aspergillus karnatakaensis TaxID=1810916 RepID=UPI003CCDCC4B
MSPRKIVVFGPTGGVGSAVIPVVHSYGHKVFLAMRDPSKLIPGLSVAEEQSSDRYERIQADLNKPDTVRAAVSKTGATHAFLYAALGTTPDHMRGTAEALKAAGIEFVVLLSSSAIHGDARAVEPSDYVAYEHAQVEISLEDVFGPRGYVTVRPAFFSSNTLWWQKQIVEDGEVRWAFPELNFDLISPDDIGAVCGTILAGAVEGKQEKVIDLAGPETDLSVAGVIETIAKVINKPIKVTKITPEENVQVMAEKSGLGEGLAKVLTGNFARASENQELLSGHLTPEMRSNIEKYLKRPAQRFSEWAEHHKDLFQ